MRALSTAFLIVLGAAAAEASQITGALLVFALLVMPASAAQTLTARPALSLALTGTTSPASWSTGPFSLPPTLWQQLPTSRSQSQS